MAGSKVLAVNDAVVVTDVDGEYQIVRAPVAGVIEASQAEEVDACGIHLNHARKSSLSAKDHATPRPASM